jgi:hypothetical protein
MGWEVVWEDSGDDGGGTCFDSDTVGAAEGFDVVYNGGLEVYG